MKKQLTLWEAACIITGYGIGAGVLAMPALAAKIGIIPAFIILIAAFGASYLLHVMIADVSLKCDEGAQVVSIFSRFLFRGKARIPLTATFFVLMAVVLVANLSAYVSGAAEVITGLLGIPPLISKMIFYVCAASVVILGLKSIGISEKLAVAVIFALIACLGIASLFADKHPIPLGGITLMGGLEFFGVAMFAFSAFFSIPQAVEGLGGDEKKIKKAIFLGFLNNFIIITVVTICALMASDEITDVAMTGWSAGIGKWAQIVGSVFTVLAMLTTYWSLSYALSEIVEEQFPKLGSRLSWVFATIPSLVLSLLVANGFLDFLELAAGAIAILVAIMVVPTFRRARREIPDKDIMGSFGGTGWQIIIILAYIGMAVGSVV